MDESSAGRRVAALDAACTLPIAECDPRQVAHFNSQALDSEGESARRWLHRYNPLRLAFVEEAARAAGLSHSGKPLQGLRILDVGCGTGIFCEALAQARADVCGIDPAQSAVAMANRGAPGGLRLRYINGLVSEQCETFDIVTAMEVVEHVPDAALFLRDCAARVGPGGVLVMSTINRSFRSWAYAIVMAERVLGLLPRGAHDWWRFMQPSEVEFVLRNLGFQPLACWGATMNLRTRLMQRSTNTSVNYLFAAKKSA